MLQLAQAGGDRVADLSLVVALVFDEEAMATLRILYPTDAGPRFLTRNAGALLGVHDVEAVAP